MNSRIRTTMDVVITCQPSADWLCGLCEKNVLDLLSKLFHISLHDQPLVCSDDSHSILQNWCLGLSLARSLFPSITVKELSSSLTKSNHRVTEDGRIARKEPFAEAVICLKEGGIIQDRGNNWPYLFLRRFGAGKTFCSAIVFCKRAFNKEGQTLQRNEVRENVSIDKSHVTARLIKTVVTLV
ncbi:hypothetical protein Tco_0281305 [Tanacetum coccineum]